MKPVPLLFFTVVALASLASPSLAQAQPCSNNQPESQGTLLVSATKKFAYRIISQHKDTALVTRPIDIAPYGCLPDKRLGEVVKTQTLYMDALSDKWEIRLNCSYLCHQDRDELIEWVVLHELCHIELGSTIENTDPTERAKDEHKANRCVFEKKSHNIKWLTTALGQYLMLFPNQAVRVNEYLSELLQ